MEQCQQCGFVYDLDQAEAVGPAVMVGAEELGRILTNTADVPGMRARRRPEQWSPIEYCCHLRDVLLVQRERALLARRSVSAPRLQPMGRDERVEHEGYAEQDPQAVARQLVDAADLLANVLGRLGDDDWQRTVIYNYPDPQERSLRWLAVHTWHEVRHHLGDVQLQIGRTTGTSEPPSGGSV